MVAWKNFQLLLRKRFEVIIGRRELNHFVNVHTRSKKELSCNANAVNATLANVEGFRSDSMPVGYCYSDISRLSHARVKCQSRSTLVFERPRRSATSAIVRPIKK